MTRQIILASGSPRRKDLLQQMGVAFIVIPSDFDEQLDHSRSPAEVAKELGLGKALAVAANHPEAIVVGGDTIVTVDRRQLGKPVDESDARATLQAQAGKQVIITSSIAVVCKELGVEIVTADEALAQLKPYNKAIHEAYLAGGDWADKAGSWGIQSGGAPLVDYIQGEYDTILGLPTKLLATLLQAQSVSAHYVDLTIPVPQRYPGAKAYH